MKKFILFFAACVLSMSGVYADTYKIVTDASTLADGDQILLGCKAKGKVNAGFSSNKKYITGTSATISSEGEITITGSKPITLIASGTNWKMTLEGKKVGHKSGATTLDTDQATATVFSIVIAADSTATITSQTTTDRFFECNDNDGRFALYTTSSSNVSPIQIYKLVAADPTLPTSVTLDKDELEMRVGDADITLTETVLPAGAVDKSVTWGTTNSSVATVSEGAVHAVSVGEAKIWVKTNTAEKTDTCYVTVRKKLDMETVTYNAVQKADYLATGAKVFIGTIKENEDYVMGWINNGNNFDGVSATYGEKRHTVTAPKACLYTVEYADGKYMFKNTDGLYLRTASSSSMNCGANDQYAKWELGTFDEDNATVTLKASASTDKYLLNNYGYDWFRQYSLNADGMAQLVLYSDLAQAWVERVKVPKMVIGGTDVTEESGNKVVDYGKVDKWDDADTDGNYWSLSKKIKVEYGDLSDNISITLAGTNQGNFELPIKNGDPLSDIESKDKKSGSYEFTVWFKAKTKGTYTATLTFHTATTGVSDVVVTLKAEAIDPSSDPGNQPSLTLSKKSIVLNPNITGPEPHGSDMDGFTFTAKNLKKKMYVKWEHSSSVLFDYAYNNDKMSILVGSDYVALNGSVGYEAGTDYTDEEVYVAVDNLYSLGTYSTKLRFYTYKEGSSTETAFDESVAITIKVTTDPATAIDAVSTTEDVQKVFRDGKMVIIRNGVEYDAVGKKLKNEN